VAVDGAGDVFVANPSNTAVEEVLPSGSILTLGSGFNNPTGVAVDAAGDVFVADAGNNRVVELSPPTVGGTPSPVSGSSDTAVSGTLTGLSRQV
jgi:DNA-binding beta-propeller fold protein YncE